MSLEMALNGPAGPVSRCPLMGVDRKYRARRQTDAMDPERTRGSKGGQPAPETLGTITRHGHRGANL
jgi:hypothetical protein